MPSTAKAVKMGVLRLVEAGNGPKLATVGEKTREYVRFSGLAGYGQGGVGTGAAGTGGNMALTVAAMLGSPKFRLGLNFSIHSA